VLVHLPACPRNLACRSCTDVQSTYVHVKYHMYGPRHLGMGLHISLPSGRDTKLVFLYFRVSYIHHLCPHECAHKLPIIDFKIRVLYGRCLHALIVAQCTISNLILLCILPRMLPCILHVSVITMCDSKFTYVCRTLHWRRQRMIPPLSRLYSPPLTLLSSLWHHPWARPSVPLPATPSFPR
jgi:hypothetical protein